MIRMKLHDGYQLKPVEIWTEPAINYAQLLCYFRLRIHTVALEGIRFKSLLAAIPILSIVTNIRAALSFLSLRNLHNSVYFLDK